MFVNFEFLCGEPIENVITFLHFKMDRAVFFGERREIEKQKSQTETFLRKYCGVNETMFIEIPKNDLDGAKAAMAKEIKAQIDEGNRVFFDITGGESLILAAFGALSERFNVPIHIFDIEKDEITDFSGGITAQAKRADVKLDINGWIRLYGGAVNNSLNKYAFESSDRGTREIIKKLWRISEKYGEYWNLLSNFLNSVFAPEKGLSVSVPTSRVSAELKKSRTMLKTTKQLFDMLKDLEAAGAIGGLKFNREICSFRYANARVKDCLLKGGTILELYTYQRFSAASDDCMVGVHIDWDGVIHSGFADDVLNEVDVIALKGKIPTFISCKNGKLRGESALHALYELETIAERFGGKYARKMLVTSLPLSSPVQLERAREMGIDVKTAKELAGKGGG